MEESTFKTKKSFPVRYILTKTMTLLMFFCTVLLFNAKAQSLYVTSGGTVSAPDLPVYIAANATVTSGVTELTGATVSISSNFEAAEDVLGIDGSPSGIAGSITYSYNSTSGILTLNGAATAAIYETTIKKVTYTNTSATPSKAPRGVNFSLNGAIPFAGNGHYFEYIISDGIFWSAANAAASAKSYFGLQGYLATITSEAENTFCNAKIGAAGAWLGANNAADGSSWKWVTGPESGTQFWTGTNFGSAVPDQYSNWNPGEPNSDFHVEDYVQFFPEAEGRWNNLPDNPTTYIDGYIVEYGGMAGDPVMHISDIVTVGFRKLVSDLVVTGTGIKWYDSPAGGLLLPAETELVDGNHYYASQTVNGVESTSRLDVTASLGISPPVNTSYTLSDTEIAWRWDPVTGATGYKWGTTNNYSDATDMGTTTTKTENGLTCNMNYTRYIWAYNSSGCVSAVTTITQTTVSCQ